MTLRPAFLLVLGALALPLLARADTVTSGTLTVTGSNVHNGNSNVINAYDCAGIGPDNEDTTDYITVKWTGATQFTNGDTMQILVSNTSNCPATNSSSNIFTATLVDSFTGLGAADQWARSGDTANRIKAADLVAKVPSGANLSCSMSSSTTIYVCVVDVTPATPLTLGGSISLNTTLPSAPTLSSVEPGNQGLYATWTAVSGSSITYKIRATAPDSTKYDSGSISTTNGRVGGLTNGVIYSVVVFSFSNVENRSAASNSINGTPIQTDDFWDRYHQAGGVEEGGCNAGSAGSLAPLLLLFPLRRRRRP